MMKVYEYKTAEDFFDHMQKIMDEMKWYEKIWNLFIRKLNEIRYFYYDFKNGLYQIFVWAPIIYRQRDYESEDIYELMLYKIKRVKKEYIRQQNFALEMNKGEYDEDFERQKKEYIKQIGNMKECEMFLNKLIEDEYYSLAKGLEKERYKYSLEQKFYDKRDMYFILCNELEKWWS